MSWVQLEETQAQVVNILKNSIIRDRMSHAYIFEGNRGTGKMAVAIQLAKSYFCKNKNEAEPCLVCADCQRIDSSNHPDLHVISPDGLSIKKEQVLHLQKEFSYKGMESKQKFYIVQDAEKMTSGAANSLLKFLEEPNSPTVAVLLTDQPQQMLKTILSRSQNLTFAPLAPEVFINKLEEQNITRTLAKTLSAITTNLDEALQLCQEDWIVQARSLVLQLTEEVHSRPKQMLFTLQDKWLPHFNGKAQLEIGIDLMLLWYRDLLYTQLDEEDDLIFFDQIERLREQAMYCSQAKISEQMTAIFDAKKHIRANVNPQLLMERLLLNLQEG